MIYTDFTVNEHSFTGHMAEPERKAERFAEFYSAGGADSRGCFLPI
ncbi:MAG: hypothetical protein K2J99_01100 [Lachnospiraceae bacterium]|nr:hypothetical protein [Lachnospiraceae bacterium]